MAESLKKSCSSRVKVNALLTVVSSKPTKPGQVHKFTALDHALGCHTAHVIFYYGANPFDGPLENDLDNLRNSLSELLCLYPHVTGRLARDADGNWIVKCNDAGVRILRAKVDASLDEWLRLANAGEERDLTVWEDMPDDPHIWSPFRIQINDFECGGMAIGISFTHMHADLTSIALFVNSWAEIHRNEPIAHAPIFNLPLLVNQFPAITKPPSIFCATNSEVKTFDSSVTMGTASFIFSDSMIRNCLSRVRENCPDATPFDVLTALFWLRIMRVRSSTKHDNCKECSLSLCIDFRKRKQKSIPCGYFGNALHFSDLSVNAQALESGTLDFIAGLVHHHVESFSEEEFLATLNWLESCKKENRQYPSASRVFGHKLTCLNLENMIHSEELSVYSSAMFKKGERPIHVSYHVWNVDNEGLILVMPSPDYEGLGRTVMVTLPDWEIIKLCEDQAILELEPVMLFSGK